MNSISNMCVQVFEIGVRAGDYKFNVGIHVSKTEWKEWTTLYIVDALPPLPSPFCMGCSDENNLLYGRVLIFASCNSHKFIISNINLIYLCLGKFLDKSHTKLFDNRCICTIQNYRQLKERTKINKEYIRL